LNGDIVDGRHINHRRPKDLPERQKRVLDAINRKIAEGTEVVYIPGNHDITLRKIDVAGKQIDGVKIEQSIDLTDAKGRKFLVLHGDQFDKREARAEKLPSWFMAAVGRANEVMTRASRLLDKVTKLTLRKRFNLANRIRRLVENDANAHRILEDKAVAHAKEKGYDGIICGHTHQSANKAKDGCLYLNSGDWIDGFTALAMNKDGDWNIIPWKEKHKELGLKRKFYHAANDNPDREFRPATEKMLADIRAVWPGKGKKPQLPKPPGA
jgi:UDP-2,3-diacylglucosamine pyrophosphatase LpxH